jgi:hypothetical protein
MCTECKVRYVVGSSLTLKVLFGMECKLSFAVGYIIKFICQWIGMIRVIKTIRYV